MPGERVSGQGNPRGEATSGDSLRSQGRGGQWPADVLLDDKTAICPIVKEHRVDGAIFTHFGLLPVLKTWDSPGEVWIDDVTINGEQFDFSEDPEWEGSTTAEPMRRRTPGRGSISAGVRPITPGARLRASWAVSSSAATAASRPEWAAMATDSRHSP